MSSSHILSHISNAQSLVTSHEQTRAGFVSMALEKNREANPFVQEAKVLKFLATRAKKPRDLLNYQDIRSSLLTASGLSEKALNHLTEDDKSNAIKGLIENFLEPAGEKFIEELIYRYLLIRGDSLGGKMRNIVGVLAERKLSRTIIATLKILERDFYYFNSSNKKWSIGSMKPDIEMNVKGLAWKNGRNEDRTLIYNLKVPIVDKNVDLCLFKINFSDFSRSNKKSSVNNAKNYLALGELKGGIDPAGADEHWKTASTALSRIRTSFSTEGLHPLTFFLGAAIEKSMAEEIWKQLQSGELSNAGNLTVETQLVALCNWLVNC